MPAAEATGLEIRYTDWFSREGAREGIAAEREVLRAAFSEEVRAGRNSDLIDLPDGSVVVIRMHEYEPAAPRPLEEVAGEIRLQLLWEKARAMAEAAGAQALERLREGAAFSEAVAELAGVGAEEKWVTRDSADVPAPALQAVFTLARPTEGAPLHGGVAVDDGDYTVFVPVPLGAGRGGCRRPGAGRGAVVGSLRRTRVRGPLSGARGGGQDPHLPGEPVMNCEV
jgi:peptidyl-prolyl cis-trans isomerase D